MKYSEPATPSHVPLKPLPESARPTEPVAPTKVPVMVPRTVGGLLVDFGSNQRSFRSTPTIVVASGGSLGVSPDVITHVTSCGSLIAGSSNVTSPFWSAIPLHFEPSPRNTRDVTFPNSHRCV